MPDYPELYRQGLDIAKLIWDGKPDEAHPQYDALINRIQQETKDPREQQAQKDYACKAMNQMDPDDVKSPGNGAAEGFCFVYWDTENKVSHTMDQLAPFFKSHPAFESKYWDSLDSRSKSELKTLLTTVNKELAQSVTDPLETHTFVSDFNRRGDKNLTAFRNGIGKPEIKVNDGSWDPNNNFFSIGVPG